jgi:glycosyltransferase involved in cell wall biosynthesis
MRDRGHSVTVFCRKQQAAAADVSEYEGVRVVRFAFPKTISLDPFKICRQKRAGVAAAHKYLANTNWDLIHIHIPLFGEVAYEAFGNSPRYVYTVHSSAVTEQKINWGAQGLTGRIKWALGRGKIKKLEGSLLRKVDTIHSLSEFNRRAIDEYYGMGEKVVVIPHWCRDDFCRQYSKVDARARLTWPENAKILFSVRQLFPRMGLDVALEALAPLLKTFPNVVFVLAGAGPLEKPLKLLADSLEVTDKVWFLGRITDDMLKRCYEGADLFILPTRAHECFGLPVLEALAYGLPIISTDAAALPESMGPILPQCIVSAGSVVELREKVSAYLEGRLDLPESAVLISYVRKRYGHEAISSQIAGMLERQASRIQRTDQP